MIVYLAISDETKLALPRKIKAATMDEVLAEALARALPKGRLLKIDVDDGRARLLLRKLKGGKIAVPIATAAARV